ncbi:MAG: class I tRNA ligase family protein [bacterium]|nr:class I tRNA ligase family protein [bacterium]
MSKYNPSKIEKKWQRYWATKKIYNTKDEPSSREALASLGNYMLLTEFAYPSGNLHIGHWYAFSIPDILARYLRMMGYNVMYPTGFDAFGLPAENAAIKNNTHPEKWTKKNIAYMTKQLKSMGATFDWSREVSTIDPDYYKWTQWIFLKLYEKGLAYRAKTAVNWCPKDKTVLANEQVIDGKCDRCGTQVEQKELSQWMFKITQFADALTDDMVGLDWQETAKINQKNWIGRSEGAKIKFNLVDIPGQKDGKHFVETFTTRADTLFGVTAVVISPELAQRWIDVGWQASEEAKNYVKSSLSKRELERQEAKEKTGVDTGILAINPANDEKVPVWVADYVLGHYGTGAIMAVPAHDERDREFATKFNLPISDAPLRSVNEVMKLLMDKGAGKPERIYRLHDWILSRQRYWGAPIPMIICPKCGYQPVPEQVLPVKLPPLKDFKPADDGRSPLAKATKWLKVKCPKCGGEAERETDTMDTFVDSSWYFLRYTDPKNKKEFAGKDKMKMWLPMPLYYGGAEHTTMHLLYARFIIKALHSLGLVDFSEPFLRRINRGIILGPDNQKMSKSRGNVVDPDIEVKKYGADAVRMYLAFMGPYEQGGPWSPGGISGVYRFLNRVWNYVGRYDQNIRPNPVAQRILNKSTKEIEEDIKGMSFNTGVSSLMKLLNELESHEISKDEYETLLKLLAPFAPHLAEELWQNVLKNKKSIHLERWPEYDDKLLSEEKIKLVIQVNGRVRDTLEVKKGLSEEEAKRLALASENVKRHLIGEVKKVIYVKDRIINLVI